MLSIPIPKPIKEYLYDIRSADDNTLIATILCDEVKYTDGSIIFLKSEQFKMGIIASFPSEKFYIIRLTQSIKDEDNKIQD